MTHGRRAYDGGLEEIRSGLRHVTDVSIRNQVLLEETRKQLDQRHSDGAAEIRALHARLSVAETQLSELRGGMGLIKWLVPVVTAVLSALVNVALKVLS